MSKIYITEVVVTSCGECPALSGYSPKCFMFDGPRRVEDIDKIPDWCPLKEKE